MRYRLGSLGFVAVLLLAFPGCHQSIEPDPPVTDPDAFVVDATVGNALGCWVLLVDSTTYVTMGLPDDVRRQGLSVRAAIKPRPDMGSTCVVGSVVEVLWIHKR